MSTYVARDVIQRISNPRLIVLNSILYRGERDLPRARPYKEGTVVTINPVKPRKGCFVVTTEKVGPGT